MTISPRADLLSNCGCKLPHPLHVRPPPFRFQSGHYCNFGSAFLGSLLHPYHRSASANYGALERPSLLFHSTTRTTPPILKSLHLSYSPPTLRGSQLRWFVSSSRRSVVVGVKFHANGNTDKWNDLPASQKFTGSLMLSGSNFDITRRLLDLPSGLHFPNQSVLSHWRGQLANGVGAEVFRYLGISLRWILLECVSTGFIADTYLIAPCRHTHDSAATFT